MPLKQDILPHLTYTSEEARDSVNTVVVKEDGLYGYSTDARGFYSSLRQSGSDYSGKNVVFIGAGAVTNLLCVDAAKKNAKDIVILNRTPEKAQKISLLCNGTADALEQIKRYMPQCDLLINTTPLGMSGTGASFETLDFIELLPSSAIVCDLIYSPMITEFLNHAQTRGLKTMNGLGMLIWQAFFAFEKFCGILPNEEDYAAVCSLLQKSNQ